MALEHRYTINVSWIRAAADLNKRQLIVGIDLAHMCFLWMLVMVRLFPARNKLRGVVCFEFEVI